ncbi:hypothetical protein BDY21DRAFT_367565 [Lineolata rhizophorae]|uniref:Uncharacterized protein n=1 Tax=Lineolata rhizophorae TaxID=578093 RepID=A0A6A6NM75_9PEZI|nr:hypothetical protein BDY21DRAFT_367565 [Lineolata rhizophorae]
MLFLALTPRVLLCVGIVMAVAQSDGPPKICYNYDGTSNPDLIPCYPDAEESICCPGAGRSLCVDNGLCIWTNDFSLDRAGCTDASWEADECVNLCPVRQNAT